MTYGATPRADIHALPPGEHVWVVSIAGDAPVFPRGYPTVRAPTAFVARELAEMLPVLRSAGVPRDRILLTRLEGTLELLRRSDAVMLAPRWEISKGALGEVAEARRLGLPVFHTPEHLERWLRDERGALPTMPDAGAEIGKLTGAERDG